MLAALLIVARTSARLSDPPQDPSKLGPAPIDRSPRLRRTLANGASVGAERWPDSRRVVFQAVLTNPAGDRRSEYGYRHVLEHLVAARDPELDRRLETVGGTMGASTGRETMRFWVSVPAEEIGLGYEALRTMLKPATFSPEEVARERRIVGQEIALLNAEERLGAAMWGGLYGEDGLDPIGIDAMAEEIAPANLDRIWRGMLTGARMSLFVAGPVELDATVDRLERFARGFPGAAGDPNGTWSARKPVAEALGATAGVYALAVGSVDDRATLAALATALALASEVEGSAVTYTPSPREGAVLISNVAAAEELRKVLRRGDTGLRNRALNLARAWIESKLDDPAASSEIRATLAAYRSGFVPERLVEILRAVREPDLDAAFDRWKELARS